MTNTTRNEFKGITDTLFQDNTSGEISAGDLRTQMDNIADSTSFTVTNTRSPNSTDDGFNLGDVWTNTLSNTVYVCVANDTNNAKWKTVTTNVFATKADMIASVDLEIGTFVVAANEQFKIVASGAYTVGPIVLNLTGISGQAVSTSLEQDCTFAEDTRDIAFLRSVYGSTASVTAEYDGFAYDLDLAQPTITGQVTTAGGVTLYVKPVDGVYNAKAYGEVGDSVADDTAAILTAIAHVKSLASGKTLYIPGKPLITAQIEFSGLFNVQMDGGNTAGGFRVNDFNLLEPVVFGKTSIYAGRVYGLNVTRPSYNGTTENIGVAFYDVAGATFIDMDSRYSKYPVRFKPGASQRVAYNTFINARATGGFRNFSTDIANAGFFNENVFTGGRCFTTSDTETNLYLGQKSNHNRFSYMALEGSGDQAVFLDGSGGEDSHSNVFDQCRTEGTWAVDDIVFGPLTSRNEVRAWNFYTTVTDNGKNNKIETFLGGVKYSSGINNITPMTLRRTGSVTDAPMLDLVEEFATSGTSYGLRYTAARVTGYLVRLLYSTTELFSVSLVSPTQGLLQNIGRAWLKRNESDRTNAVLLVDDQFANSGDINGIEVKGGRSTGSVIKSVRTSDSLEAGRIQLVSNSWQFQSRDAGFSTPPMKLGGYYLWVDTTGRLRIKSGAPTSDTDGAIVGTQI